MKKMGFEQYSQVVVVLEAGCIQVKYALFEVTAKERVEFIGIQRQQKDSFQSS